MVLDGTGSVYDDTGWYLVSISWYCLILGGTWSAKGLYACIYWKKWRFGRVLPMPDTLTHSQTTEYRATQLVSSIKHKLSHAIIQGNSPRGTQNLAVVLDSKNKWCENIRQDCVEYFCVSKHIIYWCNIIWVSGQNQYRTSLSMFLATLLICQARII